MWHLPSHLQLHRLFSVYLVRKRLSAQNNSVKDILAEIDEIAGVSTKLEEHFDMEQAQCE